MSCRGDAAVARRRVRFLAWLQLDPDLCRVATRVVAFLRVAIAGGADVYAVNPRAASRKS